MLIVRMRFSLLIISFLVFHSAFSQTSSVKSLNSDYIFKAKMIDVPFFSPGCGVLSFAVAYKFKIVESSHPKFLNKLVLIVIGCPELYGSDFFLKDKVYAIRAAPTSDGFVAEGSIAPRDFKNQKLPLFWEREIKILKE